MTKKYEKGISAIIPSYKGEKYILKLLNSLKEQTLNYDLFEAIFIINGERDNTYEIIKKFKKENPSLNINIICTKTPGVSNARNIGIREAKREYSTFIDDDDFISPKFLEKFYEYAKPNRVVIASFFDIDQDTGEVKPSYLTPPLLKNSGIIENPFIELIDILVITTAKLLPTESLTSTDFNTDLNNGVDISYYSRFYPKHSFEYYLIDKDEQATYYRLWRDNSISRPKLSYEFNITGRLKVIKDINISLNNTTDPNMVGFLKVLPTGQVNYMNSYLKEHPEYYNKVLKDIESYNFDYFPYELLKKVKNKNKSIKDKIKSFLKN